MLFQTSILPSSAAGLPERQRPSLLLAPEFASSLFEAKDFPRHRVCGEFVSANHWMCSPTCCEIRRQGSGSSIQRRRLSSYALFLGTRMIEAPVEPAAVSITRYDLDAALVERRAICRRQDSRELRGSVHRQEMALFSLMTSLGKLYRRTLW